MIYIGDSHGNKKKQVDIIVLFLYYACAFSSQVSVLFSI